MDPTSSASLRPGLDDGATLAAVRTRPLDTDAPEYLCVASASKARSSRLWTAEDRRASASAKAKSGLLRYTEYNVRRFLRPLPLRRLPVRHRRHVGQHARRRALQLLSHRAARGLRLRRPHRRGAGARQHRSRNSAGGAGASRQADRRLRSAAACGARHDVRRGCREGRRHGASKSARRSPSCWPNFIAGARRSAW